MKIISTTLTLLILYQFVFSQINDSVPVVKDTIPVVTDTIPVLSDTTQYNDTSIVHTEKGKDTVVKKKVHSPRQATIRSLILPGLGQIYNKKYWKVPIVYAAIGFPVYQFVDNKKWYNRTRYALTIVSNNRTDPDSLARVHPQLARLVEMKAQGSLINYRNQFRKNMDYSILFTLLMWGLNIVDATVDGHLKAFDVSDDLSMRIKPAMINGGFNPGLSIVLNFK
jgi:hypothetical protein